MTEINQVLLTVRIPGSIEQHRNLLKEMWQNLEFVGDYPQFVPLGVIPHFERQSSSESITWQIRYGLDPAHPQLHHLVFDLAKPDRMGAIQVVADEENGCLVKFIDAFSSDNQAPGKTLARFPALAKRFALYLHQKRGGRIIEAPKEPASQDEVAMSGEVRNMQKLKGGRPRNADDEWAYQQVRDLERAPADVFPEWQQRIKKSGRQLVDPLDSFKKAIKPRKGKK